MDLVATVTRKDAVDVWRLNGQRVFGGGFERDANGEAEGGEGKETNVKAVGWRRDGEFQKFNFFCFESLPFDRDCYVGTATAEQHLNH